MRFSSNVKCTPKQSFWLVKFLEDVGYSGMRHFDANAYRTEDYDGVKDFARGCMKTYLIFKDKAEQWNKHPEIQAILAEIEETNKNSLVGKFSKDGAATLLSTEFDRHALTSKGLRYERLDQLAMDILVGVA